MSAFIAIGGDGWTLPDHFTSGSPAEHLIGAVPIYIVFLEAFIRLANNRYP
jgi:hypothetical protein